MDTVGTILVGCKGLEEILKWKMWGEYMASCKIDNGMTLCSCTRNCHHSNQKGIASDSTLSISTWNYVYAFITAEWRSGSVLGP